MKKGHIAAGLAAAALCTGVFAAAHAGYITIGQTLSPAELDAMVQHSVQTAVQDIEEQHRVEQQEKDSQIAELTRQLELLTSEGQEEAREEPSSEPPQDVSMAEPIDPAPVPDAPTHDEKAEQPPAQQMEEESEPQPDPEPESVPAAALPVQQVSANEPPAEESPTIISFEVDYVGGGAIAFSADNAAGNPPKPAEKAVEDDFDYTLEEFAEEVFYWTNQIREEYGLPAFERDSVLDEMAQIRATEGKHLTHTRPNGSTPDTIFAEYGSDLTCTGENIAGAGGTPKSVAYGFLETSHRQCILDPDAKYMGVGCRWTDTVIGDRIATLQLFAK